MVREDTEPSDFKKKPSFEIYFIQAKTVGGFGESAIDKFVSAPENLFDLSKSVAEFDKLYKEDVLSAFEAFRKLYIALAGKHPNVKITLLRNQGLDLRDTSNVRTRAAEIEAALHRHFPDAAFEFHFAGAAELLALARKRPPETLGLPVTELLAARLRRASQGASLAIK